MNNLTKINFGVRKDTLKEPGTIIPITDDKILLTCLPRGSASDSCLRLVIPFCGPVLWNPNSPVVSL